MSTVKATNFGQLLKEEKAKTSNFASSGFSVSTAAITPAKLDPERRFSKNRAPSVVSGLSRKSSLRVQDEVTSSYLIWLLKEKDKEKKRREMMDKKNQVKIRYMNKERVQQWIIPPPIDNQITQKLKLDNKVNDNHPRDYAGKIVFQEILLERQKRGKNLDRRSEPLLFNSNLLDQSMNPMEQMSLAEKKVKLQHQERFQKKMKNQNVIIYQLAKPPNRSTKVTPAASPRIMTASMETGATKISPRFGGGDTMKSSSEAHMRTKSSVQQIRNPYHPPSPEELHSASNSPIGRHFLKSAASIIRPQVAGQPNKLINPYMNQTGGSFMKPRHQDRNGPHTSLGKGDSSTFGSIEIMNNSRRNAKNCLLLAGKDKTHESTASLQVPMNPKINMVMPSKGQRRRQTGSVGYQQGNLSILSKRSGVSNPRPISNKSSAVRLGTPMTVAPVGGGGLDPQQLTLLMQHKGKSQNTSGVSELRKMKRFRDRLHIQENLIHYQHEYHGQMDSLMNSEKKKQHDEEEEPQSKITLKDIYNFRQNCERIKKIKFNEHPVLKSIQRFNKIEYIPQKYRAVKVGGFQAEAPI